MHNALGDDEMIHKHKKQQRHKIIITNTCTLDVGKGTKRTIEHIETHSHGHKLFRVLKACNNHKQTGRNTKVIKSTDLSSRLSE